MFNIFKKDPVKKLEKDPRFKNYKKGVQNRLIGLTRQIGGNALDLVLPVRVAAANAARLMINSEDPVKDTMTGYQILHSKMVKDLRAMRFGQDLVRIAGRHRISLAAHDKKGANGYFHPRYNLVAYNPREMPDRKAIDWHEPPYDHSEAYADMMVTLYEEFVHAAQFRHWGIFLPSYRERCRPIDEQLWNILVEVHAKIIVCMAYLQFYGHHKVERLDNSLLMQSHYKPILKGVEQVYRQHGYKKVDEDASLLAPAFEGFFKDARAVDCYLEQSIRFMKHAQPGGEIPQERYINAFGALPGVKGNMLKGRYNNIYEIIFLMPKDSRLGEFFQRHFVS